MYIGFDSVDCLERKFIYFTYIGEETNMFPGSSWVSQPIRQNPVQSDWVLPASYAHDEVMKVECCSDLS